MHCTSATVAGLMKLAARPVVLVIAAYGLVNPAIFITQEKPAAAIEAARLPGIAPADLTDAQQSLDVKARRGIERYLQGFVSQRPDGALIHQALFP